MTIYELTGYNAQALTTMNNYYKENIKYAHNRVTIGHFNKVYTSYTIGGQSYSATSRTFVPFTVINDGVKELTAQQSAGTIPVGVAISSSCNFKFANNGELSKSTFDDENVIKVETGVKLSASASFTYYTIGYFIIDSATSSDGWKTIDIVAYDDIYKYTDKDMSTAIDASNLFELLDNDYFSCFDEQSVTDLVSVPISSDEMNIIRKYKGREVLGYLAGKVGKFIKINRNGFIRLCDLVWVGGDDVPYGGWYNHSNYPEYRIDYSVEYANRVISEVRIGTTSDFDSHGGIYSDNDRVICIDNPFVKQGDNVAYAIYNDLYSCIPAINYSVGDTLFEALEYDVGTLKANGNPLWEVGMSITFDDSFRSEDAPHYGNPHRLIICDITYNLTSGFNVEIQSYEPNSELSLESPYVTENEMQDYVDNAVSDLGLVYKRNRTLAPDYEGETLFNLQNLGSNEYTDNNEETTKRCGLEWTFYNLVPQKKYVLDVELDFSGSVIDYLYQTKQWNDAIGNLDLCMLHDSYPVSSTPSGPLYSNRAGVMIRHFAESGSTRYETFIKGLRFKLIFTANSDKECIGFALSPKNYTYNYYNTTTLKFKCTILDNSHHLSYYHGPLDEGIYLTYAKAFGYHFGTLETVAHPDFRTYFQAEYYYPNYPSGGYSDDFERPIFLLPGNEYKDSEEYKDTEEVIDFDVDLDPEETREVVPDKVIRHNCDVLTLNGTRGYYGGGDSSFARKFRTSDISLTADSISDYIKKHNSHIIYKDSTGLLAVNKNESSISSTDWQITGLYLRGYKYLKCYIKSGNDTGTPANNSAPVIITISLEDEMKTAGGYFCGSAMVPNINSPGTYTMFTILVNTDRDKIVFSQAYTINGSTATAANNNNRYLWKIEACYN